MSPDSFSDTLPPICCGCKSESASGLKGVIKGTKLGGCFPIAKGMHKSISLQMHILWRVGHKKSLNNNLQCHSPEPLIQNLLKALSRCMVVVYPMSYFLPAAQRHGLRMAHAFLQVGTFYSQLFPNLTF